MFGKRTAIASLALVTTSVLIAPSEAALVRETFNTPTFAEASFEATYPNFNFTTSGAGGTVATSAGILVLDNTTGGNLTQEAVLLPSGVPALRRVSSLVGAGNSGGGYNVGIRIGGNNIVFHPGFGGAALRVEGTGGFGNTNVGFTPANGGLHYLQVDQLAGGQFNIRLVDAGNPSNVFTTSFTNAGSANGEVALRRSGPGDASTTRTGIFDALTVTSGNTLYFNGFDLNVANAAQFTNANNDFVLGIGGGKTLDVSGGVARLGGDGSNAIINIPGFAPTPGFNLNISADIGATNSNGNYNVGLNIGQNNIVFHPGFGGAAFRVDGPGGFGNTNIGFTPANNVMHHLEVLEQANGVFSIKFTDGANPANIFQTTFTNPGSVGGAIGFRQEGPLNGGFGLFDNLRVELVAQPVPEPATLGLIGFAGLTLLRRRTRKA